MKKFYLQVQKDGTITDAIEYQHEGYIEHQVESLPIGINGGWFKLVNGQIVEDVAKNPNTIENRIQQAIDDYTLSLIEGGLL